MTTHKLPEDLARWVDVRKKHQLTHAHIQMARELGLNPKRFAHLDNHKESSWKLPLPRFIEESYKKKFSKLVPDEVCSIEQLFKQRQEKKMAKKALRNQLTAINEPSVSHDNSSEDQH